MGMTGWRFLAGGARENASDLLLPTLNEIGCDAVVVVVVSILLLLLLLVVLLVLLLGASEELVWGEELMVAQEVADVVVVKWVGGRMRVMKRKREASKVAEAGNEKEVGSK
jgi:hypothetical protein